MTTRYKTDVGRAITAAMIAQQRRDLLRLGFVEIIRNVWILRGENTWVPQLNAWVKPSRLDWLTPSYPRGSR